MFAAYPVGDRRQASPQVCEPRRVHVPSPAPQLVPSACFVVRSTTEPVEARQDEYDSQRRAVHRRATADTTEAVTHMKVSLVVASGVHQGKVIPITGPQFLIGRDAQCHLRPASQAISKRHCGVIIRDGKVYINDFGSTNGTLVNDDLIRGTEVPIEDGASLEIGRLDFSVKIAGVLALARRSAV